jgi:hypothetical protein
MRPETAAALAPEIDRLALCVHRPTSTRPDLVAALEPLGMPRPSIVAVAARFLAAGRLTEADLRSMSRYDPPDGPALLLAIHEDRGLLARTGDAFVPSGAFRQGAATVLRVQAEEAARLWGDALTEVLDLARAHVDAALASTAELDAFRRQVATHHVVPATDAGRLLATITELRYLRADVHADALADEGLAGPDARARHRNWRGGKHDAALERVERATDERFAAAFDTLDDGRSTALLARLQELPGDDPRPDAER